MKYIVVYSSVGLLSGIPVGEEVEISDPSDAKRLLDQGTVKPAPSEEKKDEGGEGSDQGDEGGGE